MKRVASIFICIGLLFAYGCDLQRYELKEDKQGRLVRLDKWTGGFLVLDGSILVEPREASWERILEEALEEQLFPS